MTLFAQGFFFFLAVKTHLYKLGMSKALGRNEAHSGALFSVGKIISRNGKEKTLSPRRRKSEACFLTFWGSESPGRKFSPPRKM